jgi:hypothetical protein
MPETDEAHAQAVADENRRLRHLRMIVDLTSSLLVQSRMTRAEAEALVAATRRQALELFPDKADTYDLILAPRFARLMNEFVGPAPGAKVLPFRNR